MKAHSFVRHPARTALALVVAGFSGWLLQRLNAPLPWMIGPLLCVAIANGLHARIDMPRTVRPIGQWLIGSALGLYFTLPVIEQISQMLGWIVLAVGLSMLASALSGQVFSRIGGTDPATAFFASAIGGAAEMANQAERYGARVDQVAAAQAIRVLLVVLIVPFAFKFSGVHGEEVYAPTPVAFNNVGVLRLLTGAAICGGVLWRIGVPNAWLFGPLAFSAALSANGQPLSSVPVWLINFGQLMIGCSLGARFAPQFFSNSPRYMFGVVISAFVLLAIGVAVGLGLAALSGISVPTALLATAPGGLAEMGVTAEVLQLGVPIVTAFHTTRLIAVVLSTGPAYRLLMQSRVSAHRGD